MRYLPLKKERDWLIIVCPFDTEIDGEIIYSGRIESFETDKLAKLLDYRIDRGSNKVIFAKYDKLFDGEQLNWLDQKFWDVRRTEAMEEGLKKSWQSVLKHFPKVKKIKFVKLYIK